MTLNDTIEHDRLILLEAAKSVIGLHSSASLSGNFRFQSSTVRLSSSSRPIILFLSILGEQNQT